jgi:hypothetical protein
MVKRFILSMMASTAIMARASAALFGAGGSHRGGPRIKSENRKFLHHVFTGATGATYSSFGTSNKDFKIVSADITAVFKNGHKY